MKRSGILKSFKNGSTAANLFLFLLILCALDVTGQQTNSSPKNIIAAPFKTNEVVLLPSWIKDREDLDISYIKSLDADRLLHNFRVNAGLPSTAQPLQGWEAPKIGLRGHFVGHYLSAAAALIERYKDSALTKRIAYMVDVLYQCQQKFGNGYLGAFPASDFDKLETKFTGVWAPYYTYHKIMQGLLDVYTCTGNKQALEIVNGMAAYVGQRMAKLDSSTIEKMLYTVAANPANEAGAMNEVLYNLYHVTHNPKHLALAKIFDRDWFAVPLAANQDVLSGLHSNTHLVLVNGFAQRYNITGESKYHDAVINFWNMLEKDHVYVNGSSSGPRPNVTTPTSLTAEHWGLAGHLSSTMTKEIAESCVSHNTQKLTSTLFEWTADPRYADAYMNTFYNSILALQSGQTGQCVYHLPLGSPREKLFLKDNDFRCCNGTTIQAFAALNSGIYYKNDSNLWVNSYIPSAVNWSEKNLVLRQTGNFPTDSSILFSVSTQKNAIFSLNLFMPSWATTADVYINGTEQKVAIQPSSYLKLNRIWKNDDKIKIVFHYNFRVQQMADDPNLVAIFYGPILLAFETSAELILKSQPTDILKNLSVVGNNFQLLDNGEKYTLLPFYDIEKQSYGVYATIRKY